MALNNETIELINYSKDLDFDYNIKLLLITFFIGLSLFLLWYSRKIERKTDISNMMFYFVNITSILIIGFLPLYLFLLVRTVALSVIILYVLLLYKIIFSVGILFILWWSGQTFLSKFFGVEFKSTKNKNYRKDRDYRRAE